MVWPRAFEEAGAVRAVARHGWAVVAPVPCAGDEPIGHESRLEANG